MTHHEDIVRLNHMLDYSKEAVNFNKGKKRADLEVDKVLALATVRCIEVIGEAVTTISDEMKERYPELPWHSISGTRNRLAHGYEDVNLDVIWAIVTRDLPSLIIQLERVIQEETKV